jgi:hypothetical protein
MSSNTYYPDLRPVQRGSLIGIFLLSAATLVFEINLSRLFSVAQFYHFAFLIVSLALLGYGASGTFLALFPTWGRQQPQRLLPLLSIASALCIPISYLLINWLPFDSYSIAIDRRQVAILALHYIALATPFFFNGTAVGLLLAVYPQASGKIYAANLLGSALGCLATLVLPLVLGGEGTVVFSGSLAALSALITFLDKENRPPWRPGRLALALLLACMLIFDLLDSGGRLLGLPSLHELDLHLSPYKGLSYALQYPGARVIFSRWNAFSRIDVVSSPGVRSLPGLSYRYSQMPPLENGLFVDGDDLSPVVLSSTDWDFAAYMPTAIAFQLRPQANALVLEPRGGLDAIIALSEGAGSVIAVEANPLIANQAQHIYQDPRLHLLLESERSYLRRSQETFDVILFSLTSAYHPINSGAYSLAEDYRYTLESFQDALRHLNPEGLLVTTRWLQTPPSEFLRLFTLTVSALEKLGLEPAERIVAFRGFNIGVLIAKLAPFTTQELSAIRTFTASRSFDLVYAPDIHPEEINHYNVLPSPLDYLAFRDLLIAKSRVDWYRDYPFDVTPPTDDHPFFGHFFKWSQVGQVMAELGKTWQPFGGAGYFVVLALLVLVLLIAAGLILLPLLLSRWRTGKRIMALAVPRSLLLASLGYFGLVGLAYLLVEIPLIQHFILFLGQPAYAFSTVLFSLLLFSGIGSQLAVHMPHRLVMVILVALILAIPWLFPLVFDLTLGLSLPMRFGVSVLLLALPGMLMGIPFPAGLRRLGAETPELIPWVWAVNGAASVVASVLAALLALSFGFRLVLLVGATCYAGACFMVTYLGLHPSGRLLPSGVQKPHLPY